MIFLPWRTQEFGSVNIMLLKKWLKKAESTALRTKFMSLKINKKRAGPVCSRGTDGTGPCGDRFSAWAYLLFRM